MPSNGTTAKLVALDRSGGPTFAEVITVRPHGLLQLIIQKGLLRHVFADKARGEKLLLASNLDYVNVCPGRLLNQQARGGIKASADGKGIKAHLTRADLADWMLAQLTSDTWLRQAPIIGY